MKQEGNLSILLPSLSVCLSVICIYIYHIEISHDCPTNVADKVKIYLGIVL